MKNINLDAAQAVRTLALVSLAAVSLSLPLYASDPQALTVDNAVKQALSQDPRIASAKWDALAAQAKSDEADRRRLAGITLSAGYTRLSDLKSTMSIGPASITIDSLDNVYTLAANMQYPVFAGFRLEESARLAALQAQGKSIATEMMKRAIAFETERAYWESLRATRNVRMLRENLGLMQRNLEQTKQQFAHGTAMNVDLLAAGMRCEQAEMDLRNGETIEKKMRLSLASLVTEEIDLDFELTSDPEDGAMNADAAKYLSGPLDENALISNALTRRPETKSAALAVDAAESGKKIAEAPLYPSLNVTGNYTYADPNSRVAFQSDPYQFTGTWSLGVSLSYDLGGVPANLSSRQAQIDGVEKSKADRTRQNEVVILDVKNCALAFEQTKADIASVKRMISQATENERVMGERVKAGTANDVDFLGAQIARLRSEFAIINKEIDLKIAAADLARAAALADIQ
jgi:outer membrane protein TolC